MSLRTLSTSVLVSVLLLSPLTPVASAAASFSDVPSTHPNAEAIVYVKAEGIVDGYADGTFRPNQTINRAEFTKIILEATQERASCAAASKTFSDVQSDAWFSAYVCRGKELGVIGGYPDGTFRPGSTINFAEAAKIVAQAHRYSVTADAAVWYRGSVEALGERKAIPVSIDSFEKKLTRSEMAEMIWRLKAEVTNKPSKTYGELRLRTADSGETGLPFSFSYPASWGELEKVGDGYGLWRLTGLRGTAFAVDISITAKKPGLQFITKPCSYIGCPQDTDFDTYRASLKTNRTTGGGTRVSQRDNYSAPSGSFHRNAEFFAGDYQVIIGGWADFLVYDKEYDRRVSQGLSPSISEIVSEDISWEDEHPMDIVFGLYPSETVAEQRFFMQIDAMIGSIR